MHFWGSQEAAMPSEVVLCCPVCIPDEHAESKMLDNACHCLISRPYLHQDALLLKRQKAIICDKASPILLPSDNKLIVRCQKYIHQLAPLLGLMCKCGGVGPGDTCFQVAARDGKLSNAGGT